MMSKSLVAIIKKVEQVLKNATCKKYSFIDRLGILKYHTASNKHPLPFIISSALQTHCLCFKHCETFLETPIFVFFPDNLSKSYLGNNIDLTTSLRLKLGKYIYTYENLVSWYLSISF